MHKENCKLISFLFDAPDPTFGPIRYRRSPGRRRFDVSKPQPSESMLTRTDSPVVFDLYSGRKIIVDTYGGWGAHGGGAFSGKDFSKVDRSAAYTARWIAKSLVAAGLARRALVQLSYAIGVAEPLSVYVDTYGTGKKISDLDLVKVIRNNWDLRPGVIVKELDLQKPQYLKTASYGHFGNPDYTWEKPKSLKL